IDASFLYHPKVSEDRSEDTHYADRLIAGLAPLGVEPDALGMEVFYSDQDTKEIQRFLEEHGLVGKSFTVFHAGCHQTIKKGGLSGAAKRTWPLTHWKELAEKILESTGSPPVLVGFSQGDRLVNAEIRENCAHPCPEFMLNRVNQLAALLRRAAGFVCVDTGPLHVASAAGAPTVALFGPSRSGLTGPYRNRGGARVLQKKIPCVPCKGNDIKCDNNICMQLITPEEVLRALAALRPGTSKPEARTA
ncbi:MAG: hypothetical protein KJ645_01455, partial [Planctomycetes bacterium]|nr:hypothetical protein [Planctomycetota bacterium]